METRTGWYHYIAWFFGGAFLANTIPHLANGISGSPFKARSHRRPARACRRRSSKCCIGNVQPGCGLRADGPGWPV